VIVGEKERRDFLTRFFLGSTAQRVVEYAPCPVIIAKGQVGPLRHVLLCDSGAESSSLLAHVARLADLLEDDVEITVLHVMSQMSAGPGIVGGQLRASAEDLVQEGAPEGELLARDVQALGRLSVCARAKVRHGLVVEEILDEAQGEDYDLIVIGAHRGAGWQRILLDDLACKIIEKADRPVLVVK
jgi:nucleotide-binding universal stress UspA family protein